MIDDTADELRHIHHEIRRIRERLIEIIIFPVFDKELAMSAIDELQALGARIDAVTAALPADVATAVAAQKAADDAAVTTAQNALTALQTQNATDEAALEAGITTLTSKVAALEAAAGIPATPPAALSVAPATVSFSIAAGASSTPLTITGATARASASGLPEGVLFDGMNLNFAPDGTTVAGTSTVTISDSPTPPLTADIAVTIA